MNIFYLDEVPEVAAAYHCDKHAIKMSLEYAQMLCTAHHVMLPNAPNHMLYKITHRNNLLNLWLRSSRSHYRFLYRLWVSTCEQYAERYNRRHASERLAHILAFCPDTIKLVPFTPPPQCMPNCYKNTDTVLAYRLYYMGEKRSFATWRNGAPYWWPRERNRDVNCCSTSEQSAG